MPGEDADAMEARPDLAQRLGLGRPWRLVGALLAAGLAATLAGLPALLAIALATDPDPPAIGPGEFLRAWIASLIFYPAALALALIGALPVHLALAAAGRQGWRDYGAAGALAGAAGFAVVMGARPLPMLAGLAVGLAAALAFRAVLRG
jgi:hypothetical protein